MASYHIQAFEVQFEADEIHDLCKRLSCWRAAEDFQNADWRYGVQGEYLHELVRYWHDEFNFSAMQKRLNMLPHFRTTLQGVPIHFVHLKSGKANSIPLILTHGWPWTFWDFHQLLELLRDPSQLGARELSFDLVVPSLPGYAFSSPLKQTGIGYVETAGLWQELMTQCLGYERYAAYGGDWGALVAAELGHRFPESLRGIHLSMPGHPALGLAEMRPEDITTEEAAWFASLATRSKSIESHLAVHRRDPQTLAYALNDSPVGLAAWILERRRAWSDCNGELENRFSKEELLTHISLYWFTQTIATSMRFYWESFRSSWKPAHSDKPAISVPTGIAVFPKELVFIPRKLAERNCNLVHWSVMESGGHFAPAEEPRALATDLVEWSRKIGS